MQALIMAGGLGTRLRPLTCNTPKPMVPLANRPILEHTINLLRRHKITKAVLLLYHLPDKVKDYFGDGSRFGVEIEYLTAYNDYGTAGAVKQAAHLIGETTLILSGDAVTDLNLSRFVAFHKAQQALVSIALAQVNDPSPFGIVIMDQQQRITRFLEKPSWGEIFSDMVNMGIYVIEPEALDAIPTDREYYFAKDVFPRMVEENQSLYGFVDDCYWKDIGDVKLYRRAHLDFLRGTIKFDGFDLEKEDLIQGEGCQIGRDVTFHGKVVIGENCRIGDGATLSDSVIGPDCQVGERSRLRNTILWRGVEIGPECDLTQTVVGFESRIGGQCFLEENVVVSDHCLIGAGSRFGTNVKLWPNKEVEPESEVTASIVWGEKWQRELITDARVTGLANFEVSPELGARLGAAFGGWAGKTNDVLVSRDAAPAARMIYRSVMCGLMSAGVHVQDLQVAPIPIVRYTIKSTKNVGGIHVRRSPFDKRLLDILIFDEDGRNIPPGAAKVIERIFYREDYPRVEFDEVGDIEYPVRMSNAYVQDFLSHIDVPALNHARFKIVVDFSHGSAAQVFASILGSLECELIALNAGQDSHKLSHTAVSFERALQELSTVVKSTKAHIGFLLDAGAEKVFCVDETGEILASTRLSILMTKLFLETARPRRIAVKVSVPGQIETLAHEHNVELVYTPEATGGLFKATKDPEVGFAADSEGGFIFPEFQAAYDGMFSIIKILELLAKTGESLQKLNSALPKRSLVISTVPCPWDTKGKVMRRLDEYSADMQRLAVDGVRILIDGGWVLVTPDKEKALYNIMAEADCHENAENLVEEFRQKIIGWIES